MDLTTLIGSLAGILTTIAFVPQVIKTHRSQSAHDISLLMFLLFCSGVLFWLIYGILLQAMPIIIANAITLALAASILIMKIRDLRSARRRRQEANQRAL